MERDFMGFNSKDTIVKEEALEGCKESDGFEAFNNHQMGEVQSRHDTKQAVPVIMRGPFFSPHFAGAHVNPQLLGGVPVTSPHLVFPSSCSFFSPATEPWYSSKSAPAPAQLTIFYGGMMNVYDGISPEKAQAIMFLARNMAAANAIQQRAQAHVPTAMNPALEAVSSPLSVSSHPDGPAIKNEAVNTVMSSFGQAMQSAIPQARKASLARFLEKRKERVMASAPYSLSKNSNWAANDVEHCVS